MGQGYMGLRTTCCSPDYEKVHEDAKATFAIARIRTVARLQKNSLLSILLFLTTQVGYVQFTHEAK